MKKFGKLGSVAALSLSAVLGLGAFAALAQTSPDSAANQPAAKGERRAGKGKGGKHRHGHGQRGGRMMFGKLNLSDAQKTQLKDLRKASRESGKALHEQLRAKRLELRQANAGGNFNEAVAARKLAEMAPLQAKMMAEKANLHQQMLAILTPQQKTQLETARADRKAKWADRKAKQGTPAETKNN